MHMHARDNTPIANIDDQNLYLLNEYCVGGDLCEACHRPTPPGFFLRVARGVASGMSYLHRKGILHR